MLTLVSFFFYLFKKLAIAWERKNHNDKFLPVSTGKKVRHLCKLFLLYKLNSILYVYQFSEMSIVRKHPEYLSLRPL